MPERIINRREFLKKSAALGGSLVVGGTILNKTPGEGATEQLASAKVKTPEPGDKKVEEGTYPEKQQEAQVIEWLPDEVKELWPIIKTEADQFNIDPRLIAIIITEESGGKNVSNTEGSGATGPMQLMKIAYQEYLNKSGDPQHRDVKIPADNIHIGCWHVNNLNENYFKPLGIDIYSDIGILSLAVGYGDGVGVFRKWQQNGMKLSNLSEQAKKVSRLWTGMWHERNQSSSHTLNTERGYNA